MIIRNKEKFKTFLLLLLVITSLIQIGIRWNQQVQGFPIHFISRIFNGAGYTASMDVDSVKNEYFIPEDIIVSMGFDGSQWKLDHDDSYFKRIWEDIRDNYLPAILKQKPGKVFPEEQWSQLTGVRCIFIDFTVNWPGNIISWLEDEKPRESGGFGSVKAIAVLPQADVNETVNTVYIYDEKQVYQYQVIIKNDFLPKNFYLTLAEKLENEPSLYNLSAISNFKSKETVLVSTKKGKVTAFESLKAEIPPSIVVNSENIETERIQDKLLLSKKDSLMAEYDETQNQILFTDTENLYRLHNNGIFEYKYLPAKKTDRGEVAAAFKNALSFIEFRRNLLEEADIILTEVKTYENYYEFYFAYGYKGIPIFYPDDTEDSFSSPLVIKVNSERILECRWMIRSFTAVGKPKRYSLYFSDLINNPILLDELNKDKNGIFERIVPGYVFRAAGMEPVTPSWIISIDSEDYVIPLTGGED